MGFLPLRKMILKIKVWTVLFMSAFLTGCTAPGPEKYQTFMDSVTAEKVNKIIRTDVIPSSGENYGDVISRVSSAFLGTPYQADTLIGGPGTPEALVVNFNGVDCFVLADYVEALTRSHDQKSFLHNLAEVRYTGGNVDYLSRQHFFSYWFATTPRNARDVTPDISSDYDTADKQLNHKLDGGVHPGLVIHPRKIRHEKHYIFHDSSNCSEIYRLIHREKYSLLNEGTIQNQKSIFIYFSHLALQILFWLRKAYFQIEYWHVAQPRLQLP